MWGGSIAVLAVGYLCALINTTLLCLMFQMRHPLPVQLTAWYRAALGDVKVLG